MWHKPVTVSQMLLKAGRIGLLALIEKLIAAGRFDAIGKISKDKEYLRQLYKEYHII